MIVRFPFSSTLYCDSAGRLGFAVLTAAMTLSLSSPLRLLESATSTFVPATGSYFLVVSRTVTVIFRSIACLCLLIGSGLPSALKTTIVSPRGCFHETVPFASACQLVTLEFLLSLNPPVGSTPLTLKAVSLVIPKKRKAVPAASPVKVSLSPR